MKAVLVLIVVALLAVGCAQDEASPRATSDEVTEVLPAALSQEPYDPEIDPARFGGEVDNPYFPLKAGTVWKYEGETEDGTETTEVAVTDKRKDVLGIDVVVVRDTVKVDGEIVEDTFDWFAQDDDGNVWYMGEDSYEYEDGKRVNNKGSWEAGVDGAKPGIIMPAEPEVGQSYRQEFYEGEAEDTGEIVEIGASIDVPAGSYDDVVVTEDLNPLEPDVHENKYYARGVGLVAEKADDETLELISVTRP